MTRTLAQKMFVKPNAVAWVEGAPDQVLPVLALDDACLQPRLTSGLDHAHLFVRSQADLQQAFPRVKGHLGATGQLWVSWPKGRRLGTDLSLHEVIRIGYAHGMVESTCLSVDDVWSALRFTFPKAGKTYRNSHAELNRGG